MKSTMPVLVFGLCAAIGLPCVLAAETAEKKPAADHKLTVAVLDFAGSDAANPNVGSDLAAALTAMLSGESGITLVERQSLTRSSASTN